MKRLLLFVAAACISVVAFCQPYYSKAVGDLDQLATWGNALDGTGASPGSFGAGDQFIITNRASATIGAAWSLTGGSTVQVGDGVTSVDFTIPAAFAVSGTVNVSSTGTLTIQNATNPTLGTLSSGSTVVFDAAGPQTVPTGSYSHIIISNDKGGANVTLASGTINVGESLTVTATNVGGYTVTGNTVAYNKSGGGQTIASAITYNNLSSGNTTGTNSIDGNLTVGATLTVVSATTLNALTSTISATTFTLGGTTGAIRTQNTSATPFPSGRTFGGIISYDAATGGQTIVAGTYARLIMGNTSGTNTAAGNIAISTVFTTTVGGTLDMGTNAFTGAMGTITNNGTVLTQNTSATPMPTGDTWGGTGTLEFNGSGSQTIPVNTYNCGVTVSGARGGGTITFGSGTVSIAGLFTLSATGAVYSTTGNTFNYSTAAGGRTIYTAIPYNNLTSGNTSGINTCDGNLSVSGTLVTTSGGVLDMSTFDFAVAPATITNNGTVRTSSLTNPALPTGRTWTGTTGAVQLAASAGSQVLPIGSYTRVGFLNTSGTSTVEGDITLAAAGVMTVTAGGTANLGTNTIIGGASMTTSGTGTLRTQNTSATPIPTGRTWAFTVEYDATTGGQTIMAGTYTTGLVLSNTSGTNAASGNLVANSVLTISNSGSTLDMGTFTLTGTLSSITNNGVILTANTSATPLGSAKNWAGTGSVEYTVAGGGQTIMAGTYNTLVLDNASGINDASNDITVNTSLVTTAGGTFRFNNVGFQLLGGFTASHSGILETICTVLPAIPAGKTWGGTILYSRLTGAQELPAGTYNNVTFGNTSGTNTVTGTITVNGALETTTGTGVVNMSTFQLIDGGGLSVTNNGRINTSSTADPALPAGKDWSGTTGIVNYALTTGNQFIPAGTFGTLLCSNTSNTNTVRGDISVGTSLQTTGGASGTLDMGTNQLSGAFTPSGAGTLRTQNTGITPVPAGKTWTGTINYDNATGGQTIMGGTYVSLTSGNTSGVNTAEGNFSASGTLTYTAGGVLNMGTQDITSVGTIAGTGTLRTQSLSVAALPAGESWTGTVEYNAATGLQTIAQGTYSGLLLSNTSGSNAAGGNLVVNSSLELTNSSAILNLGTSTLTGTLTTITNNGTIQTANTTTTPLASGKNWNGMGSVEYTVAGGGQTVMAGTYNALVLDNSSGFDDASNDITVNTALVTTAGGTFRLNNSGFQLLGGFTPTNNGTISTICTVNPAIPAGLTWGGTVLFSATAGAQELPAGTYNNLTFANTSGTNTVVGTITVNGTLTTTTGTGVLNMNTFQLLDGGGLVIVNNGRINTSCTDNPALPTGKTWTGTTGIVNFALTSGGQFIPSGTYGALTCSNTSGTNTVVGGTVDVSGLFQYTGANTAANIDFGTNLLTGIFTPTVATGTLHTQNTTAAPVPTGKTWTGRVSYDAATGGQTVMTGTYTGGLILGNSSGTQTAEGTLTVNGILSTTAGGTLEMNANTIAGNLTTVTHDGTLNTAAIASAVPAGENWTGSGTVIYTVAGGGQSIINGTFNNLTMQNTSGTNSAANDITVNGTLTTTAGGTFEFNNIGFELIGAGMTVSHAGTLRTLSTAAAPIPAGKTWGGTVEYIRTTGGQSLPNGTFNNLLLTATSGTVTATGEITVNGNLTTASGGFFSLGTNQLLGTLTPTNNGSILTSCTVDPAIPAGKTWTGTTGLVTFARTAGGQFVPAGTYGPLTLSNTSSENTVTGDIDVSGVFRYTGANTAASLNMGTNLLTGSFTTATATGVLRTQNTTAAPVPTGKTWSGRVNYDAATGGQTVMAGTYSGGLLTGNSSGTQTAEGSFAVNGIITTTAGGTLEMGSNQITGAPTTITNDGTIRLGAAASAVPAGESWGGTGTVVYTTTTGGQSIINGTYVNLTLSNSSGTNSALNDITVNGTLTTTAGGTFDFANVGFQLLGTITPVNNGTIQTICTVVPCIPAGNTWGGTIIVNRTTGSPNLPAGTYNNVTFGNSAGTVNVLGDITVNGNFVTTSGGLVSMSTNQLSGTLTATHNGTLSTAAVDNPPIPAGKNWTGTTGLINYTSASGGQFVPAGTYGTLSMATATSGTNTAVGNITCTGTITTNGGAATLDMTTFDLSAATITNNSAGFIRTQSTSATPISSGHTIAGTVIYDAATGGQTIVPQTSYNNLTLSHTSGTNTAGGNIVVNATLTTGSGTAIFDLASNTLNGSVLTPAGGGKITTQNTSAAPIKSGRTWTQEIEYNNATGSQTVVNGTYNGGLTNSNTSGTNTLEAASAPTVNGALTLSAGSVLADNDRTLTVNGNIVGTGTHNTSTSGRITVTGAGATISGATLGNLTLNNAAGFSLSGSPTVNGTLTLTSGRLTIGTNNLTLGTAAPAIAGTPSSANMIVATGTGEVRKNFSATGSYLFPVGDATGPNYTPATVNVGSGTPGGSAYIGLNVSNTKHPQNANTTNYLNRYWTVNVNDFSGSDYSFTGTYVDGDIVGTETSISNARYNGVLPWVRSGSVTAASNQVNLSGVTDAAVAFSGLSGSNPTVNVTPASPTTCSGTGIGLTANGSGDPVLTYSWAPATGLSATTGANVTATITSTVATTQEYTVTVTDGNGFTGTGTVTVSVNPVPVITGALMICNGTTNTLNATPAGGAWASSNPTVASVNAGTGEVTGNAGGTANITYTDLNTCSSSVQVSVTAVLAGITGPVGACEGGSTATLANTVSGGTWSSSTPANASIDPVSGVATALVAGTTTVTYLVNTGCFTTRTFVAYANPAPITGAFTMCEGVNTGYTSTIGGSGTWISSNTSVMTINSASGLASGVGLGTSIISYRIPSTGCQVTQEITVNPTPTAITGGNTVCAGSMITLASTPTGGTWVSHNTEAATIDLNTGDLTGVSGGSSNVTYALSTGCRTVLNVTVNPLPAGITGTLGVCVSGSTTLSSSTGGGAWSSSDGGVATISGGGVVTPVSPGTTTISYTMGTGCARTAVVTVSTAPAASTGTAEVCVSGSTTLSNASVGGTWSSSNTGRATVGAATGIVTGVSTGTVNITYALSGAGCFAVTEVTVSTVSSAITGTTSACVGLTSTLAHVSGGGTWSSANAGIASVNATTGEVTAVSAGTTTITYEVSATCFVTTTFTSKANPSAITGTFLACVGTTTALANATPEGVWSSSNTGIASVNALTGVVTGVSGGNATISYLLPSGCVATQEVTINAAPSAITGTLAICDGSSTTLSCTPGGGTWASSNVGVATINTTTGDVTTVTPGTTTISYTNASGCISTTVFTVGAMPAAISGTLQFCNGSSTTLTNSTGGGTWTSSNGAVATVGSSSGIVTGTGVGNSTISYNHSGGCVVTAEVTVDAAVSAITGTLSMCVGGSSTLANADAGGTWSSSNTSVATVGSSTGTVTGTGAGNATISYNTGSSCYATAVVSVGAAPAAITGLGNVCLGQTITLSHITGGGTWSSSNPAVGTVDGTTGVVGGLTVGATTITYTPAAGCFTTKYINVLALPTAISGTLTLCETGYTTLTSGGGSGTWSSSNGSVATVGSTSGLMTGVAAGNATITYTHNSSGCYATAEATINGLPAAISGGNICVGSNVTYTSATVGGTWTSSNTSVATIGSGSGTATGVSGGGTTISYTISNGCRRTLPVTVNAVPASISGTLSYCPTGSGTLSSSPGGGTWSSDDVAASISGGGVITATTPGTSLISYTLGTGCARTAVVTVNAALAANTGNNSICVGGTTTLANATSGGTWTSSVTANATVGYSTGLVTAVAAGTSNISYIIGSVATGCVSVTQVTVNAAPAAITGTLSVCIGQTTTLSHTTGGGTWSTTYTSLATIGLTDGVVTGVSAGNPVMTYVVSPGCFRTTTVSVKTLPSSIVGTLSLCTGSASMLYCSPASGVWSSSATSIANVNSFSGSVSPVAAGNATITYTGPNGCRRTAEVTVNTSPANITGASSVAVGANTTFSNTTPSGTWTSSNTAKATVGAADGIVTGVEAGSSVISYTLAGGCYKTRTITVTASRPDGSIYFATDRKIILSVFPNPTSGALTIEAPARGMFGVYSVDGKKIVEYPVVSEVTNLVLPKEMAAGAYMCRFDQEDGESTIIKLWYQP